MSDGCNILVSSAGRRVVLLDCFRRALADLGVTGRVLAADQSRLSSAFHHADEAFEVPPCATDAFVPALVELCARQDVRVLVPTIDPELGVLAANRARFAAVGTTVVVSSAETIGIAADKARTHAWLEESAFPTVRQAAADVVAAHPGDWPLPVVVKPRYGSAGEGVAVVGERAELDLRTRGPDMIVQSVARGLEHTIDVLVDRNGRAVCAVPRRRLEVRGGEVAKAITIRCPELERLAGKVCEALPEPYGPITLQAFHDEASGTTQLIELNPRFGGGFPLSWQAGARYPTWILEDVLRRPSTASPDAWRDGLVMLRYDDAVFVDADTAGL